MRKCRKMISLIMLMVMLVSLLPSGAMAAEAPTGATNEVASVEEPQGNTDEAKNEDITKGETDKTEDTSTDTSDSGAKENDGTNDVVPTDGTTVETTDEDPTEGTNTEDAGLGNTSTEIAAEVEPTEQAVQKEEKAAGGNDISSYILTSLKASPMTGTKSGQTVVVGLTFKENQAEYNIKPNDYLVVTWESTAEAHQAYAKGSWTNSTPGTSTSTSNTQELYYNGVHMADAVLTAEKVVITFNDNVADLYDVEGGYSFTLGLYIQDGEAGDKDKVTVRCDGKITEPQVYSWGDPTPLDFMTKYGGQIEDDSLYGTYYLYINPDHLSLEQLRDGFVEKAKTNSAYTNMANALKGLCNSTEGSYFIITDDLNEEGTKGLQLVSVTGVRVGGGGTRYFDSSEEAIEYLKNNYGIELTVDITGNMLTCEKIPPSLIDGKQFGLVIRVVDTNLETVRFVNRNNRMRCRLEGKYTLSVSRTTTSVWKYSGGWFTGKKGGTIEVFKYSKIDDKEYPIEGVTFTLKSSVEGQAVNADGDKTLTATTDADGIVKFEGLLPGQYLYKEESAPEWVALDTSGNGNPVEVPTVIVGEDGSVTTIDEGITLNEDVENTIKTGNLKVEKTVSSNVEADKEKEFTFKITLNGNDPRTGKPVSGTFGDMTFANGVASVTLKDGESATATGLPIGLTYTVEETNSEGFSITKTGDSGKIAEDKTATASFTIVTKSGTWKKNSTGWWYRWEDGTYPTGKFENIDGKTYYFNASGYMVTGWQKIDGKWYYFSGSGAMVTGWQKIGSTWYYLSGSGVMVTGWQKINGKWYYFSGSGAMQTGWQKIGGTWYYLSGSGAMVTGWQKINNKWYYFRESGAMVTGRQQINGKWYTFSAGGAMQ